MREACRRARSMGRMIHQRATESLLVGKWLTYTWPLDLLIIKQAPKIQTSCYSVKADHQPVFFLSVVGFQTFPICCSIGHWQLSSSWRSLLLQLLWHWSASDISVHTESTSSYRIFQLFCSFLNADFTWILVLAHLFAIHDWQDHLHSDNFQIISSFWTLHAATYWTLPPAEALFFFQSLPSPQIWKC